MKYKVVTNLTGVKRNGKDGEFEWKEEIIYMKWGKEERKEEGLLHISEYLGDIMMLSSTNKERSPRKEKKKLKKDKRKRPSA